MRAVLAYLLLAWASVARAQPAEIRAPHPGEREAAPAWSDSAPAGDGELALPKSVTRGRITVRAEASVSISLHDLAVRADAALADDAADLADLNVPAHVELRVVADARDLGRAAPPGRGAPGWAAGVAYPDLGVVVIAVAHGGDPLDYVGTTEHEMAHLALGAALGPRAPHWLHEGFAWQHSPTESDSGRLTTLVGMTWFGSTIPLAELDESFPADELPASRAYAESYELVEFLASRGRWDDRSDHGDREPFRRFLRNLAHGEDLDLAAAHAFGRPMSALFDEWESDLKNRYLWVPVELFGLLLWLVAAALVVLAWRRRRRQRRITFDAWEREASSRPPPPFVPWPGAPDPLAPDEPDDDLLDGGPDDGAPRGPLPN
jgi:hypothetical protein